jgi:hypothetical protein
MVLLLGSRSILGPFYSLCPCLAWHLHIPFVTVTRNVLGYSNDTKVALRLAE